MSIHKRQNKVLAHFSILYICHNFLNKSSENEFLSYFKFLAIIYITLD